MGGWGGDGRESVVLWRSFDILSTAGKLRG